MLYCDNCGSQRNYPIQGVKIKGWCEVYNIYAGPCNEIDNEIFNNISNESLEIEGFEMKEIAGFPVNQRVDMIDPTSQHKMLDRNTVLFYHKNSLVLANTKTGKRVEISF